jgi:hypothetical protein
MRIHDKPEAIDKDSPNGSFVAINVETHIQDGMAAEELWSMGMCGFMHQIIRKLIMEWSMSMS